MNALAQQVEVGPALGAFLCYQPYEDSCRSPLSLGMVENMPKWPGFRIWSLGGSCLKFSSFQLLGNSVLFLYTGGATQILVAALANRAQGALEAFFDVPRG